MAALPSQPADALYTNLDDTAEASGALLSEASFAGVGCTSSDASLGNQAGTDDVTSSERRTTRKAGPKRDVVNRRQVCQPSGNTGSYLTSSAPLPTSGTSLVHSSAFSVGCLVGFCEPVILTALVPSRIFNVVPGGQAQPSTTITTNAPKPYKITPNNTITITLGCITA